MALDMGVMMGWLILNNSKMRQKTWKCTHTVKENPQLILRYYFRIYKNKNIYNLSIIQPTVQIDFTSIQVPYMFAIFVIENLNYRSLHEDLNLTES